MATLAGKQISQIDEDSSLTLSKRWQLIRSKYLLAFIGGTFFALICLISIFAPLVAPRDPTALDMMVRTQGPSWAYPFGTDELGRDMFSRIIYGGRPILLTGITSIAAALLLGMLIGVLGGYVGGWTDDLLMRAMDIMISFPAILLAILIVAALGPGLTNAIIAIAVSMVPIFARLIRSVVMSVRRQEYVTSSRALGGSHIHTILHHVIPNMIPPIIVQASAMLAIAISYSAALNFIGLGVEPPTPDWGVMVSDGQRLIFDAPHVSIFSGLAITLTVLSLNYVGDGLRDWLDPIVKRR